MLKIKDKQSTTTQFNSHIQNPVKKQYPHTSNNLILKLPYYSSKITWTKQ